MNEASAKSVVVGGSDAGQNGDNDDREEGEVTPIQAPCILVEQTEELAQSDSPSEEVATLLHPRLVQANDSLERNNSTKDLTRYN
jgi:hypothetical protein